MDRDPSEQRLTCFVFLWALAGYFELLTYHNWIPAWTDWVYTLSVIVALCRPASRRAFVFLLLSGFCQMFFGTFIAPSNVVLMYYLDLVLLAVLWYCRLSRAPVYPVIAPLVRSTVVAFYFFIFLAKLNTGFFNEGVSCAAVFVEAYQRQWPLLLSIPWAKTAAIWGCILLEGGIPVMFLFERTRHWGIAAGFVLHLFIAFMPRNNFIDLSALMAVFYFFFLSDKAFAHIFRQAAGAAGAIEKAVPLRAARELAVGAAVCLTVFYSKHHVFYIYNVRYVSTAVFYFALIVSYILAMRRARSDGGRGRETGVWYFIPRPAGFIFLLLPFLVREAFPYLGLSTLSTGALYCNLNTVGERTNHFLVPGSAAVFKPGLVKVLDSNSRHFKSLARRGYLVADFEFRRMLENEGGGVFVRCMYKGREMTVRKTDKDPQDQPLVKPLTWIQKRMGGFYPVDTGEYCRCSYVLERHR